MDESAGIFGAFTTLVLLAFVLLIIASWWRIFTKAGWPGWAAIIPIYNAYVYLKIAGKPGWWLLLYFIPLVNVIIAIVVAVSFAERFGKGVGFALGLIFLGFIFYPILAFGEARYTPPPQQPQPQLA
jgi:hypothetical protein